MTTITSKSEEIAGLHRTLEKTREQLHKALEAVVDLSARNSELRAAIRAIQEKPLAKREGEINLDVTPCNVTVTRVTPLNC